MRFLQCNLDKARARGYNSHAHGQNSIRIVWACSSAGRAFGSHPRGRGFESLRFHQQKSPFVERQKGIFERCVPQAERDGVMCPSDVMCAPRVIVTLAEHITSLYGEAAKHHCELCEQHHCAEGTTSLYLSRFSNYNMFEREVLTMSESK